jgi:hypothetical protein
MCIIFEAGAASEKMRITSDGNVGIGISVENPIGNGGTYRNLLVGNGAGYGVFQGISTATATNSTIVAFSGGTTGASANKNGGSINLELDGTSTSAAIGRWAFYTNNGTSFTEKMRITSGGNVGIGTTTPIDKFEVVGALTTSGTAAASKANSGYLDYYNEQVRIGITGGNPSTPAVFRIDQYSCDYSIQRTPFYIASSGNIGIGCLTPSTKLQVAGGLKSSGTTELVWIGTCDATQPLILTFKAIGGATSADRGMAIVSTEAGLGSNFFDINETSTRTRFFSSGNVNIGSCAATSYRLNVNGAFYAAGSSQDYKQSICNYNTDSCMFMKLKPVTYQYKEEYCHLGKELKSGTQIGLIAEEVVESHPELAILVNEEDEKVVRNVDYEKLTIILLSELQKLRQEVDQLKNK